MDLGAKCKMPFPDLKKKFQFTKLGVNSLQWVIFMGSIQELGSKVIHKEKVGYVKIILEKLPGNAPSWRLIDSITVSVFPSVLE